MKTALSKGEVRPPIHVFGYGDSYSDKSTFAATFPYPTLVWFMDGLGMELPYRRRFVDRLGCTERQWRGPEKFPITSYEKDGKELCRIEFFNNVNPSVNCRAFPKYLDRMQRFAHEREHKQWKTGVLDGCTGFVDAAYEYQEFGVNPGEADQLQMRWAANVTNNAHGVIKGLSFQPINIVILCHIMPIKVPVKIGRDAPPPHPTQRGESEYQDTFMRTIALPGRLGKNINVVASKFPEFYRFYVPEEGGPAKLQTRPKDGWVAKTQIPAPDGVLPRYANLWKGESTDEA